MSGSLESESDQKDAAAPGPVAEAAGDDAQGEAETSVEPTKPRRPRKRAASRSGSGAAILAGSSADQAAAAPDQTESLIVAPRAVRKTRSRAGTEQFASEPVTSSQGAHGASGGYGDTWPYYDLAVYDQKRDTARKLAIGAAVLGMGGLVLAAWLNQDPQPPRSGAGEPVVASAKPATIGAVGALEEIQPGAGADVMADATAGLTPEERAVMATDTMAASSSLGQWFGSLGGPTGEVALPQASSSAQPPPAQSAAEPGPAEALAMATRQALASGQSQETAVAAPASQTAATAKAPEPQAQAVDSAVAAGAATSLAASAPPAPTVTRTAVRAVPTSPTATPIITPAKWISGGPTNADNRRGRYRGSVVVQFTVQPVGRASNCTVVRPSGNPEMDTLTCRIVTDRARFTPARDAAGRPVDSQAHATYVWGRKRR